MRRGRQGKQATLKRRIFFVICLQSDHSKMPTQVQNEVAEREMQAKIKSRLLIAKKSEECEIIGLPITHLPHELWSLHTLNLLWVNNNHLVDIDPAVGNLTRYVQACFVCL